VSLEAEFWTALLEIASGAGKPLAQLIDEIDKTAGRGTNLSSALRIHVLNHFRGKNA
jgi:predicted DNA-binding ribbon-helix-helix protein